MFAIRRNVLLNRFSHRGAKFSIMTGSIYEIDSVLRGCVKTSTHKVILEERVYPVKKCTNSLFH